MVRKRNHVILTGLFESQIVKKIVNIPFTPMYTYKNWSSHYIKQALGIILNILKCLLVGLKFHLNHPFLSTCKPIWVDLCCLYAVCCMCSYVIQMGKVDGANATILQCSTGPGMVWWLWQWDKCVILQLNWHNSSLNFAMSCCFVFIYHPLHHYSTSPLYLSV